MEEEIIEFRYSKPVPKAPIPCPTRNGVLRFSNFTVPAMSNPPKYRRLMPDSPPMKLTPEMIERLRKARC